MSRNLPPPIRQWFRYRIFVLSIIALYCMRFGVVYTPLVRREVRIPPAVNAITAIFPGPTDSWQPVWMLGFIWIALAGVAFLAMVTDRAHNWAFIGTASFTLYWTLGYLLNQFTVEAAPAMGDTFTGLFLLVGALMVVALGLLTRPAKLDETPLRAYREDTHGGHRVI